MGKEKYVKEVLEFLGKTPVASMKDIRLIINRHKDKKSYSSLFIHNLTKSNRINRVTRGFYTIRSDPVVSVFCFKPAYIGLQDALSFHNLWEQETNVVLITSKRVRSGLRKILGSNVILRRIDPKYFFGYDLKEYNDIYIPVSDMEKTLIDFVHFKDPLDKEVLKNISKKIDKGKINSYLKLYPKRIRKVVLNLLAK